MKRLILFFLVLLTVRTANADEPLFFVQLTDTHFGQGDHFDRARKAVEAINKLPVDIQFVAVTGDIMNDLIADTNAVNEALDILDGLNMPVHFVPGNHDIFSDETASIYTNRFGPLLSLAEYEGVEFVFIYTEAIAKGVAGDGCRYKLLEEFDGLLQNLPPDQPVIVFHHRPSIGWGRSAEAAQRWQELLNRHDVKAVIAGHFHCDEMHWLGRVPLYIGPPLSGRIGRQAAFRIYEYCDGNLGYRTQYLD